MMNAMTRHVLACGLVASAAIGSMAACTAVSSVHQPLNYLTTEQPTEVWVIRKHNDTTYRISQPRLQGDTLIGFSLPSETAPITQYQEIPLTDVRQMKAKQAAPIRTAVVLVGLGTLGFVAYEEFVGNASGASNGNHTGGVNFCECDFDDVCVCTHTTNLP